MYTTFLYKVLFFIQFVLSMLTKAFFQNLLLFQNPVILWNSENNRKAI